MQQTGAGQEAASAAAAAVVQAALAAGTRDNATAVTMLFDWSGV
jgi:hypothetical protein